LLYVGIMLFGRLRVPFERLAAEPRESARSAHRAATASRPRGDSPRRPISLVPPTVALPDDEYVGLDRLDREELDE
jgi:hypothetical protein